MPYSNREAFLCCIAFNPNSKFDSICILCHVLGVATLQLNIAIDNNPFRKIFFNVFNERFLSHTNQILPTFCKIDKS